MHERTLKIGIITVAVVALVIAGVWEFKAEHEFDVASAESAHAYEADMAKNRPFYDCIVAAMATVDENSPEANQRAAVAVGHECYKKRK